MKTKALAAVLGATMALAGCSLFQAGLEHSESILPRIGGGKAGSGGGTMILPKRCALKFIILSRPQGDAVLDSGVWQTADAQAVGDDTRRALEANGMRVGLISGELPPDVQAMLDAPPPNRVDPAVVVLPSGDNTLVELGAQAPQIDLILSRQQKTVGKPYLEAKGFLRLAATQDKNGTGVRVRIAPELHHGPIRRGWSTAPAGTFDPQQLVMKDGQQEESFRELAAELVLQPGQVAVIGGRSENKGSLGGFLFTKPEPNSDRLLQKVVLVWASRSDKGDEANVGTTSRPAPAVPPGLEPVDPPDVAPAVEARP